MMHMTLNYDSKVLTTPSFLVYKAHMHIKIQTFISLTNNLTINF